MYLMKWTCFHKQLPKLSFNKGFTLAEVLVTLGIIGVVAALTMPTLIDNHRKVVTETRLEKFYSLMSQAVLKWEDKNNILPEDVHVTSFERDSSGFETWYKNGLGQELKSVSEEKIDGTFYKVILADGSGFSAYSGNDTIPFFYCVDAKYCDENMDWGQPSYDGKHTFLFVLAQGKFMTSLASHQTMSREDLLQECKTGYVMPDGSSLRAARHACTRLIEVDGWKIKDDYPWNQTILEKNK